MSLQFIKGASGSGKSTYLYEKICQEAKENPTKTYIVLVPDQFTLETQKTMVEMSGRQGIMNIDVLSFHRLAYRVLEVFPSYKKTILEDMGKMMILRKVFAEQKDHLKYFKRGLNNPGFLDECKSFFCELMQYAITDEDMDKMRKVLGEGTLMDYKLQDLQLIYREFKDKMGETYMMAEELIPQLTGLVSKVDYLQGATICLDGFTGFTPTQYELIEELLRCAEQMYVTVTTDRTGLRKDVFYMSDELVRKMTKLASALSVEIAEDVITGKGEDKAPYRQKAEGELAFLERNIFSHHYLQWDEKPEELAIRVCKKQQDEAAFVARTIWWLTRKEGYQYDEIAVVVSQPEQYEHSLTNEMEKMGIRYFYDQKKNIGANELAEYLLAFMAMYRKGMDHESTFRYLRCGLSPLDTEEVDILDNYVVAKGRRGFRSYCSEWKNEVKHTDINLVNEYREKFVDTIHKTYEELRGGKKTVKEFTTILYHHLTRNEIYNRIQEHADEFEKAEKNILSKEYRRIYKVVMAFFDELVKLLGDEVVTFAEYEELMRAGISEGLMGFAPPEKNQVKIGDIERSRLKDIKVLFFVGITDDVIPKATGTPGILSESERKTLEENGMELAPQGERVSLMEQYYLYLTMTKPSEKLYVTYSKIASDGTGKRPAYLVHNLKKMFPLIEVFDEEMMEQDLLQKIGTDYGKKYFLTKLLASDFEDDEVWKEIAAYHATQNTEWWNDVLQSLMATEKITNLSKKAVERLYGDSIYGSVTRMETYAKCPFKYFIKYGLALEEREEYVVGQFDFGNVFHKAVEHVSHRMEKEKKNWNTMSQSDIEEYAKEAIDYVVEEYNDGVFFQSERDKFNVNRMKRVLEHSLEMQSEQMKAGDFVQLYTEKAFSGSDNLEAVQFDLANGKKMTLHGVIDRVDACEKDDKELIKVIDYKDYTSNLKLSQIYHGLQLQLVTYLSAALEIENKRSGKETIPAAMLYYQMKRAQVEWKDENEEGYKNRRIMELRCRGYSNNDEEVLEAIDHKLVESGKFKPSVASNVVRVKVKKDGNLESEAQVLTAEQFDLLQKHVHNVLEQYGNDILNGKSDAIPYRMGKKTSCDHCEFKGICGKEKRELERGGYRDLKTIEDDEIWGKINGED